MEFNWGLVIFGAIAIIVFANAIVFTLFGESRSERQFNEFFVCLVLYELGAEHDSSMPLGMLREILLCHPDEADETIAHLESRRAIEIYHDDCAPRVRLGARPYLLLETGNWQRAFPPPIKTKLEYALAESRRKLSAGFGVSRVA